VDIATPYVNHPPVAQNDYYVMLQDTTLTVPATAASPLAYPDFSDTTGLQLNGNAQQVENALRVAPAADTQAGSVFTRGPRSITDFDTSFTFRMNGWGGRTGIGDGDDPNGADGLTFTIQPNGTVALGQSGGGLGYMGIPHSVAIEFDTWNNGEYFDEYAGTWIYNDTDSNHVGLDVNGSVASILQSSAVGGHFDDGLLWRAWISYHGNTLKVYVAHDGPERPPQPALTAEINLHDYLGVDQAYVGFTAATGWVWENVEVTSWTYSGAPVAGVLANDTDPDGDALQAITSDEPESGNLILNPDGSFEYVPRPGFTGTVHMNYQATDGVGSGGAEITIEIKPNPCVGCY